MATSKDFLNFVLEQLSELDEITYRMMMGEYIIYYKGKIAAELCDNRFLVKPVDAAVKYIPNAVYEPPYEGAKPMILVENIDSREYLTGLFEAIYPELPAPKPKKKKQEETK
ncbi:MAG: TfoX/Sxy family protein [Oscillospiraceae bacterium]